MGLEINYIILDLNIMAIEQNPSLENQRPKSILTANDVRKLTLFKWRYSLESAGFTPRQAEHLLFLKWRVARGKVTEGISPENYLGIFTLSNLRRAQ